jgi:hypothetical protein
MSDNPWDKVERTFGEYIDAISKESLANISHSSAKRVDPDGELCRAKYVDWKHTQEVKSKAYVAHVHAVDEALKSSIPCPW